MTTEEIMDTIVKANILDKYDIATIERGLFLQDAYNQILDDSLSLRNPETGMRENKFGLRYQIGQNFNKPTWKGNIGVCKDCAKCMKQSYNINNAFDNTVTLKTNYTCTKTNKETFALNNCDFFEAIN